MVQFDWSTFPILVTPRLVLRQMVPGDAADLFSMPGDPEVQKYDSDPPRYSVARPFWRRGIAPEAVCAVMRFGFETLCLHRINVNTRIDNVASVRLMQKLGFHAEGVWRECIRSDDGTYQSWGLFGMLENEYHC